MLLSIDETGSRELRTGPGNSHVLHVHREYAYEKLSSEDMTRGPGTLGARCRSSRRPYAGAAGVAVDARAGGRGESSAPDPETPPL